jgi:hypothetical protein
MTVKSKTIAASPQEYLHIKFPSQHHEIRRQLPWRRTVTDATKNVYAQPGVADGRIFGRAACPDSFECFVFWVLSLIDAAMDIGKRRGCAEEGSGASWLTHFCAREVATSLSSP